MLYPNYPFCRLLAPYPFDNPVWFDVAVPRQHTLVIVVLVEIHLLWVARLLDAVGYLVTGGKVPLHSVTCAVHPCPDRNELLALFQWAYLLQALRKLTVAESEEAVVLVTVQVVALLVELLVQVYRLGVVHYDSTLPFPIAAVL